MQDAAWLAVPGNFPRSREWSSRAYTQLARLLFGRRDAERLDVLADEITRWEGGQAHEKELANVIRAGVKALRGDMDGVIEDFNQHDPSKLTDPALLALSLDIVARAEELAGRQGVGSNDLKLSSLRGFRQKLLAVLFHSGRLDPMFAGFRFRGG
jgi:serine/threonine-protein kinase